MGQDDEDGGEGYCDPVGNGLLPGVQHEGLAAAVQPIVLRLNGFDHDQASRWLRVSRSSTAWEDSYEL